MADTDMTANEIKISRLSQSRVHAAGVDGWINRNVFIEDWIFIPQSDLEWLAVNEPEWFHDDCSHIRRKQEAVMYTDCPERKLIAHHNWHAKQQWQNTRYELGLDEKPKVTEQDIQDFADGLPKAFVIDLAKKVYPDLIIPITINCPCTTAPLKDTKMIDLTPFKIGDKLITRDSDRVKVVFLSESQMITEDEDGSGCLNMYKLDGTCIDRNAAGNFCSISDIVSRYEPVILQDFGIYKFTIGGLINCVGTYIEHRKSFMNCGNKVCGVSEAKDIVRLTQEQNSD